MRVLGGLVAGLVVLFVLGAGAAVLFIDSDAVENQVRARWLPVVSERLGTEVTVGGVSVDLFPRPSVDLRALRVAGPGEWPLLETKRATARLAWWPLIRSLGREVQVSKVQLEEPVLRLERQKDGAWSFEPILERLEQAPASERALVVDLLSLKEGRIRVIDHEAQGGTAEFFAEHIEVKARNFGVGRTLDVSWRAALGAESHNLEGTLQVQPWPESFKALQAAGGPTVSGSLSVNAVPVDMLEPYLPPSLSTIISGGVVNLEASLATDGEHWELHADSSGQWLLRGEPAKVSFAVSAEAPRDRPSAFVARINPVKLEGPGVDVSGEATATWAQRSVSFEVTGPLLDLSALLGEPPGEPDEKAPPNRLSDQTRRALSEVRVEGTARLDRLVAGRLAANDVTAHVVLAKGILRVEEASGGLYGGRLKATGSTADLTGEQPRWHLKAGLDAVALPQALDAAGSDAGMQGALDATVDLRGQGLSWAELAPLLSGVGQVKLSDASLSGENLSSQLLSALTGKFKAQGLSELVGGQIALPGSRGTRLGDVSTTFAIQDGWMTLRTPLSFDSPLGEMKLSGRMGLDRSLAMTGTVMLKPDIVASLTRGQFKPRAPIALPFTIGGAVNSPRVTGLDTSTLVRSLARQQLLPDLQERLDKELGEEVRKRLPNLFRF